MRPREDRGLGERTAQVVRSPGLTQQLDKEQFLPGEWPPSRDFAVVAASHQVKNVTLAADVPSIKTATPLVPDFTGWRIARLDERPQAYSHGHYTGGEEIVAWRAMTVETYQWRFRLGDAYSIVEINDRGDIRLAPDLNGPIVALSTTQILLDAAVWAPPAEKFLIRNQAPEDATTETPEPIVERVGLTVPIEDDDYIRES